MAGFGELDTDRRLVVGCLLVFALVALAGCSYDPPDLCGACSGRLNDTAADYGVNVTVETSHLAIDLQADGSARWTVYARLSGEGVDRLRANRTLVDSIARDPQLWEHTVTADARSNVSARMDGETLVLSYPVREMGTQTFGDVLVVDYFYRPPDFASIPPYESGRYPVVVRGPPGSVVVRNASGDPSGNVLVWGPGSPPRSDRYLAFDLGGDPDPTTTKLAVAFAVLEWAGRPLAINWGIGFAVYLVADVALAIRTERAGLTGWMFRQLSIFEQPNDPVGSRRSAPYDVAGVLALGVLATMAVLLEAWGVRELVVTTVHLPVVPTVLFVLSGAASVRWQRHLGLLLVLLFDVVSVGALVAVLEYGLSSTLLFLTWGVGSGTIGAIGLLIGALVASRTDE